MATAGDVFATVASFMDDPERDVFTDSYLIPFLNQCNKRLYENVYANPNIQGAKLKVILNNVPQGTTSLASYLTEGNVLALLTNIYSLREKPAGTSDSNYREMQVRQDIPVPLSDNQQLFNGIFVQAENDIMLPGASQALDFRVFGEFKPSTITDGETPILPSTDVILVHWVCEVVGMSRGSTREFIAYHRGEKDQAISELFNALIMDIQSISVQQLPFDNQASSFDAGYL